MHLLISGNTNEIPERYLVWPSFLTSCPCFSIVPPGKFSDSTTNPTYMAIYCQSEKCIHPSNHTQANSKGLYLLNWVITTHFIGRIPKQM
jgi:hypothetical protein